MAIPTTGALTASTIGAEFPDGFDGGNPFRMSEYRGAIGSKTNATNSVSILPRASDNAPLRFSDFRGFQRDFRIDVFLIGGGGAGGDGGNPQTGGASDGRAGGGGGAGAITIVGNLRVNVGQSYSLQAGAGGSSVNGSRGNNGNNSTFDHNGTVYRATGGGGGGSIDNINGRNGGCGGGGSGGSSAGDGTGGSSTGDGTGKRGGNGASTSNNAEGGGGGGYSTPGEDAVITSTDGDGGFGYRNANGDNIFPNWMGTGGTNDFFSYLPDSTANTVAGGGGGGRTTGSGDGASGRDNGGDGAGWNPNTGNYNKPSISGVHRTGAGGGGGLGSLSGSRGGNGCVIVRYRFNTNEIPDYVASSVDNNLAATGRNQIDGDAYRYHIFGRTVTRSDLDSVFTPLEKLN